jgi:hypothetical protein
MSRKTDVLFFVALALWLGLVAVGVAMAAHHTNEPPFWDALSYAEKSKRFWDALDKDGWKNPLEIEPTIRPPGVIAMAYPFGFSWNFHRFYFRCIFIPIAILAAAAVTAGWRRPAAPERKIALAGLTLVLAGMPILYQFQPNDFLRAQSNWGLVDGLLAAVTAFAMAAALRSVRHRSIGWAGAAALAAAYGLFVKPAGLILMGLVGIAWIARAIDSVGWRVAAFRDDRAWRSYALISLALAAAIYAWAVTLAFQSPYYSTQNIQFGLRNLEIFHNEVIYAIDANIIITLLHHSTGWLTLLVIAAGVASGVRDRRYLANGLMAMVCIVAGVWFWAVTTNIGDVRYFLPFVTAAFVLTMPGVLSMAERNATRTVSVAAGIGAAPVLLVTLMLLTPLKPLPLQRALGVNLLTDVYRAENDQANALLIAMKRPGTTSVSQVYIFGVNNPLRAFAAVIDHHNSIIPDNVWIRTIVPVDWHRGLAFHCDEIVASDFLAFIPVANATDRGTILAHHNVVNYEDQAQTMSAWATELGPDDGVSLVSQTRVRVLHVTDREKLAASLQRFVLRHTWPQSFRDANDPHWWTPPQ